MQLVAIETIEQDPAFLSTLKTIRELEGQVPSILTDDPAAEASVMITAKDAKELARTLEDNRKNKVGPLNDAVKLINNLFRDPVDRLAAVESKIKRLISDAHGRRLAKIREEEARAAAENAKRQAAHEKKIEKAEAAGKDVSKIAPPIPVTPSTVAEKTVHAGDVTRTMRKVKKWVVTDIRQVPAEYLVVDATKMNAAIKIYETIPGISITIEEVPVIR